MHRRERRLMMHQMGKYYKKVKKMTFPCLFPGCEDSTIKSHSQQREGQLRAIAQQGTVYALERNFYRSLKPGHIMEQTLVRTGIAEASTFQGFCGYHDKKLFSDLERRPLVRNDSAQAVLLYLRAISYEYTQKRRGAIWLEGVIDIASGIAKLELAEGIHILTLLMGGMKLFVDFDGPFYLNAAFDALEKNPDLIVTEWETVAKNLMASSCCCFSPLRDDHIEYKNKHRGEPGPLVMFSLVPEENQTHVVVSWHRQDSKHTLWIKESMVRNLERFINECAIAESEDTCLNPNLWEKTSPDIQKDVQHAIRHNDFRGPLRDCPIVIRI